MGLVNKRSWQQRLREFLRKPRFSEQNLDELEDLLLEADMAPSLALGFTEDLRRTAVQQKLGSEEQLLCELAVQLERSLLGGGLEFEQKLRESSDLQVIMLLGVNGVGKTTSLAKLAHRISSTIAPDQMTIGAGDTFRAAAIEQLQLHGRRLGVRVVAQQQGSDSAAVIYDAVSSAAARGHRLVLLDTAGRMHTRKLLLEELAKINRVLERLIGNEQRHNVLVLDATTGKNAQVQAETFCELIDVHGALMSKMDAQCGGGVVFSLGGKLQLPVWYEGRGEKYEQLAIFDPNSYVCRLLGL